MPKGSVPRRNAKMLKTRPVAGGAQQYVRGATANERSDVAYNTLQMNRKYKRSYDKSNLMLGRVYDEEFKPVMKRIEVGIAKRAEKNRRLRPKKK